MKTLDGIIKHEKHNPDYKLIETIVFNGSNFITYVYGITNNGENEGLEIYFSKKNDGNFYKSRRYLADNIPSKHKRYYESLSTRSELVNDGHKLTIELLNE